MVKGQALAVYMIKPMLKHVSGSGLSPVNVVVERGEEMRRQERDGETVFPDL